MEESDDTSDGDRSKTWLEIVKETLGMDEILAQSTDDCPSTLGISTQSYKEFTMSVFNR